MNCYRVTIVDRQDDDGRPFRIHVDSTSAELARKSIESDKYVVLMVAFTESTKHELETN